MRIVIRLVVAVWVFTTAAAVRAEDSFYAVGLNDLRLTDGKFPETQPAAAGQGPYNYSQSARPTVRLDDSHAEAYLVFPNYGFNFYEWMWNSGRANTSMVLTGPAGVDLAGTLLVPNAKGDGVTAIRFTVPSSSTKPDARKSFFDGKRAYYDELLNRNLPGSAWFRFQSNEAAEALGAKPTADDRMRWSPRPHDDLETMNLLSGGRAVSENLQLDRQLFPHAGGDRTVPIDSIEGITVKPMDWTARPAGAKPELDRLARAIPADQHAIYFPSFDAAMTAIDEADLRGTPIFEQFDVASEDSGTKSRYRKQLCLPSTTLGRLLGPTVIKSMAVTGSDPYLRVGSDVAVLFEPTGTGDLHQLLTGVIAGAAGVKAQNGDGYTQYVSDDRSVCSYHATIGGVEVVTNSLAQLSRLRDAATGKSPAMASADDYVFFRNRYSKSDGGETGLVVLTDGAIRRWCSPRWRIGDSRRTRAAAVMADVQARHADEIANGTVKPGPVDDDLEMTPTGVRSKTYGTLSFMTPIAELDLDKATTAEADMYKRWRDTYQQNWSNYFDPIAAKVSVDRTRTAVDLSVVPLIAGSEYNWIADLTVGAKLSPAAGDRHDDLLHFALAINRDGPTMKMASAEVGSFAGGGKADLLGWVGPTVAVYVDDDPIWKRAVAAKDASRFFEDHINDMPIVLYAESSSQFKLAAFLLAVHAFVDKTVPNMTRWVPQTYHDVSYTQVVVTENNNGGGDGPKQVSIYYTTVDGALVVTPNEPALKRAIDRRAATTQPTQPQMPPLPDWPGDNYCGHINVAAARDILSLLDDSSYQSSEQQKAWANLPILNEWRRRYPTQDPLAVQEKLFQTKLLDPAGGKYVWNEALGTMESTTFGCPEKPKAGPAFPAGLAGISAADFGITFDGHSLRAKGVLTRSEK